MELLIPHACTICGFTDEAEIRYAGPHLKMSCNHCRTYHKFYSKHLMPDHQEIKLRIWGITQDTCEIEAAKRMSGFADCVGGLDQKLMYWNLYLTLRENQARFSITDWVHLPDGSIGMVDSYIYPDTYKVSIQEDGGGFKDDLYAFFKFNQLEYIDLDKVEV